MKKFALIFFTIVLFFSCKNNDSQIISYEENDTLKSIINVFETDTIWTNPIEPEILEESLTAKNGIQNNILINQQTSILNKLERTNIYPSIEDFTIIYTDSIEKYVLNLINTFSKSVCEEFQKNQRKLLNDEYSYIYMFFKSNLYENWYIMFNEKFPYSYEEINGNKKIVIFTDYLIGQQEENSDYLQIPVRFYNNEKYVNTVIYIEKQNKKVISNIEITGWGGLNGK